MLRIVSAALIVSAVYVFAAPSAASASETGWLGVVVARGELKQEIESTPIVDRPNRPFHVYGNTVRRRYYRGTAVPRAEDIVKGGAALVTKRGQRMINTIVPADLHELVQQGRAVDLIDVRTPEEYQDVHVELAKNVPLNVIDPASIMRERKDAGQPLFLICKSGGRSERACEQFIAAGFPNVVNVEGGTAAWLEADLPVIWGESIAVATGGCGSPGCGCQKKRG